MSRLFLIGSLSLAALISCAVVDPRPANSQDFLRRLEQRVQGVLDEANRRTEPNGATRRDGEMSPRPAGYLGLTAEEDPQSGIVEVVGLKAGSPAQLAGLRVGDQIMSIDGRDLRSLEQLSGTLGQKPAGAKITLGILREGRRDSVRVTLSAPTARGDVRENNGGESSVDGPSLDRPRNESADDPRVPGESQSVLRRLERSLTTNPRSATRPEVPDNPANDEVPARRAGIAGDATPRQLLGEIERLEQLVEELRLRVEQLERRLGEVPADDGNPPLPEPKP